MAHKHYAAKEAGRLPGAAWGLVLLSAALVCPGVGCRVVRTTAELPGKAVGAVTPGREDAHAVDPVELQQNLMRFADEFSAQMVGGIERIRPEPVPLKATEALRWKIGIASGTSAIVTGPNAVANLLDLTAFVTVIRATIEAHWHPRVFGESARPLLDSARAAETNIWTLAAGVLQEEQLGELRDAIETWHRENPLPESVLATRAIGFTSSFPQVRTDGTGRRGSVFDLLNLDPLAGLDPATRELAETRLLAERAMFLAHRMPTLLRWQTELLALNTTELPALQQLLTNTTTVATAVQEFSALAKQLPGQVAAEREQILKALQSQEDELAGLAREIQQSLVAGAAMSTSLNTTLTTFDALMERFGVGETNRGTVTDTNAEPFRIKDYESTARQLELTARQLTELLATLGQTIDPTNVARLAAGVSPVILQARDSGNDVVDRAFRRGLLLVGAVFAAALFYRLLVARLNPTKQ